jgi:hypothetical protein
MAQSIREGFTPSFYRTGCLLFGIFSGAAKCCYAGDDIIFAGNIIFLS